MICKQCNNNVPNDSEYCPFCGNIVEKVIAETNPVSDVDKGYTYLELKEWKKAKEIFDFAIVNNDNKAKAYIGRLLAKMKLSDLVSLSSVNKKLTKFDDFKLAVKYADDNYKQQLEKLDSLVEEKINQKKAKSKKRFKMMVKICLIVVVCVSLAFGGFVGYKNLINPMVQYSQATKLLNNGKYDEAIKKFESLKSYKDSEKKIKEVLYQQANDLLKNNNFIDAFKNFEKITDYKDTNDLYTEAKYTYAVKLYNESNFIECAKFFSQIKDYKDSNTYLQKQEVFWRTKGNIVTLGSYEQDNNSANGKERIEWIVLDPEYSTDSVMLISKYCLEYKLYDENDHCVGLDSNEIYNQSKDRGIGWLDSTLRKWLNNSFYNTAFDSVAKSKMKPINITYSTTDNVSILSLEEAKKLFANTTLGSATGTQYAYQSFSNNYYDHHGKKLYHKYNANESVDYWLRKIDTMPEQDCVSGDEAYKNLALYWSYMLAVRPIIVVSVK